MNETLKLDQKEISVGKIIPAKFGTECLICNDFVELPSAIYQAKICEKCRAAVMKIRESEVDTE